MFNIIIILLLSLSSYIIFNFIFYKVNSKFGILNKLQNLIECLNEDVKKKLQVITFVAIAIFFAIISILENNFITLAVDFGLVFSLRDICFRNSLLENLKNSFRS